MLKLIGLLIEKLCLDLWHVCLIKEIFLIDKEYMYNCGYYSNIVCMDSCIYWSFASKIVKTLCVNYGPIDGSVIECLTINLEQIHSQLLNARRMCETKISYYKGERNKLDNLENSKAD